MVAFLLPVGLQAKTIRISGSSTVYPITRDAIAAFRRTPRGRAVRFDLQETGSSAGLREFCSGRMPMVNASRPISSSELQRCEASGVRFIELPIAFDAISIVVNPANTWAERISTAQLRRLWSKPAQGRINQWQQVNSAWPARPIALCGPGKDSGTFDIFNKAINGSKANSRTDYLASEDDSQLVRCVANNVNALGYFGFGYYRSNARDLKALAVVGPEGAVPPSVQNVQKERYLPLSRPLFLYLNAEAVKQEASLRRFVSFYVRNGLKIVKASNYVPLPSSTYALVEQKFYRQILGTSFGGDLPVGLTIGAALDRSFDQHKRPGF
ncbi:PstS family phosphate ABC transporter substrate-binding protein [Synechococcus sp. RSCCF101]|uniref:PstS family phosphate ABC transporter substrate-binding protein n=1 Tax=Synechococcus sp. RSCCF101 TaxID=2511069 RepID=UPI001CD92731|nr:PstS family phosphate ABC transporter substrate-binding protein [Synechococcus sp. RSCCF101]